LLSGRDPSSFHRQDQQISRLPKAAVRSLQQKLSSTSAIVYIVKIFNASPSRIVEFIQIDGLPDELPTSRNSNPIQAEIQRKVFVEKQRTQQASSSSPGCIHLRRDFQLPAGRNLDLVALPVLPLTIKLSGSVEFLFKSGPMHQRKRIREKDQVTYNKYRKQSPEIDGTIATSNKNQLPMQLKSRMRNTLFSTTLRQRCKSRIDVSARMLAQIPITSGKGKTKNCAK
jgi:hypothetical protein